MPESPLPPPGPSGPPAVPLPPPVDYRATALRPSWPDLPPALREAIQHRLGGPVVAASTAGGGFTRGFASVLTTASGARGFVKAADLASQHHLSQWYYHEVLVTHALPPAVPAPRPRWTATAAGWYAVCFDAVDGTMPVLPWRPDQLAATLSAWATTASALRQPPDSLLALDLPRLADLLRSDLSCWQQAPPRDLDQVPELAALEAALPEYVDSSGLTHCDLRPDNVLIDRSGAAWFCDWNWVCHGAPWFDTAGLLVYAYASDRKALAGADSDNLPPAHHRLDADRLFAAHPTAAGAPPDALDATLAALAGYLLSQATAGPTDASPALRAHQRWSGEAALAWLSRRRGWPRPAR
jgi:aminoglycoside phosphotransferase (APT) family kinase protein